MPTLIEALQAVPQAVHAHFITREEYLWSSLQPENLIISTTDLTLKYGGTVSGEWQLLYVLDAWSDAGQAPDFAGWSAGQVIDSILTAMHGLRTMMGRPAGWMGITPLLIFRSISGWIPKPIPATTPTPS